MPEAAAVRKAGTIAPDSLSRHSSDPIRHLAKRLRTMKETNRAELRALRPALYHRFHGLLPFVATPLARRFWRLAGWLALAVYFALPR